MSLQNNFKRVGRLVAAGIIASSSFAMANFAAPAPAKAACFTSGVAPDRLDALATYNSCDAQVRLTLPNCLIATVRQAIDCATTNHFNIGFGQREKSQSFKGPIFSGQREREEGKPFYLWGTRPRTVPVVAYFRYQACRKVPLARSSCTAWSDPIVIDLGNNELTAR